MKSNLTADWTAGRFYAAALVIGIVYVFVTPVFTVPDEIAHFWRAAAISRGKVLPASRPAPVSFTIDDGIRLFVWHVQTRLGTTQRYEGGTLADASRIAHKGAAGFASFTALYTPVAYLPQAVSIAASQVLRLRPIILFYLGRLANLAVWMGVIAAAILLAPQCAPILVAVALLPMTLFQFASWSADAAAIALAMLITSLTVRAAGASERMERSEITAFSLASFLLSLCKPVYFLLPALAITIPGRRFRSRRHQAAMLLLVAGFTAGGTAISMTYFDRGYSNLRTELPVNADAQIACIRHAPLRFLRVVGQDVMTNGRFYGDQFVGRFGANEIKLPNAILYVEWLILSAVALTTPVRASVFFRLAALAVAVATIFGVIASQYIIWSIVCCDTVEGVQGRYVLPVIPLVGIAVGGVFKRPLPVVVLLVVVILCNAAAIATILIWYA